MTAGNEPPDRLERLREKRAEHLRAVQRIGTAIGDPPRLRDRNGFFNTLLNGERDVLDRVRPQWRERRLRVAEAARIEDEIDAIVRLRVRSEPGYRALVTAATRERDARRACKKLLASIRAARQRIAGVATGADTGAVSRATVNRDAKGVSKRLQAVRRHAGSLKEILPDRDSIDAGELAKLHVGFSRRDGQEERSRRYAEVGAVLGSLERTVKSLQRKITARQNDVEATRRRYTEDGRARYDR